MVSIRWVLNGLQNRIDAGDTYLARIRKLNAPPRTLSRLTELRRAAVAAFDHEVRNGDNAEPRRAEPAINAYMNAGLRALNDLRC